MVNPIPTKPVENMETISDDFNNIFPADCSNKIVEKMIMIKITPFSGLVTSTPYLT